MIINIKGLPERDAVRAAGRDGQRGALLQGLLLLVVATTNSY